jgi:DNA-directed RNA polymerase subunit RPC12/RpoP
MKMMTCPHCSKEFDYSAQTETSMGTVACPHCSKAVSPSPVTDHESSDHESPVLRAKYSAAEFDGEPPTEFMYMPGGVHTVWLSRAGKPAQVTVNVTPATAVALQAKFDALQKERAPQRPYFDFEHKEEDASAWPLKFSWKNSPEPGVYVAVEWSKAGKDAVVGKVQRAFSPVFFADAEFPNVAISAKEVIIPTGKRGSAANPAAVTGLITSASTGTPSMPTAGKPPLPIPTSAAATTAATQNAIPSTRAPPLLPIASANTVTPPAKRHTIAYNPPQAALARLAARG